MSNKPYKRNERLAHNLLEVMRKTIWSLHGNICNLTNLKLSKDFKYADVYLQTDNVKNIEILQQSEQMIIREIRKDWHTKFLPKLRFHLDKKEDEIDKLIKLYQDPTFQKDIKKDTETDY